jgi:hypothetical protein
MEKRFERHDDDLVETQRQSFLRKRRSGVKNKNVWILWAVMLILTVPPDGSYTLASPAVSDGRIFIRTEFHLYCIGR